MELTDYENDPYAPDPRASQRVAAQKRAQQPAHDAEPLAPLVTAIPMRRYVPFGVGALVLIMLMVGAASYQLTQLPDAKPLQITPAATEASFVAAPTTPPAPTSAPTATARTIDAYAAPDGLLLGQIEETRQIVPVAHYGSGWIQADVAGSGLVWLRAADVPDVGLTGPDLAPVAVQQPHQGRGLTVSGDDWTPPDAVPVVPPDKGTKPADDRAARRAAALAREQQPHGQKGP